MTNEPTNNATNTQPINSILCFLLGVVAAKARVNFKYCMLRVSFPARSREIAYTLKKYFGGIVVIKPQNKEIPDDVRYVWDLRSLFGFQFLKRQIESHLELQQLDLPDIELLLSFLNFWLDRRVKKGIYQRRKLLARCKTRRKHVSVSGSASN